MTITYNDVLILSAIKDAPATVTNIGKMQRLTTANVSTRIFKFQQAGFVDYKINAKNRCEKFFSLTEIGERFLDDLKRFNWRDKD